MTYKHKDHMEWLLQKTDYYTENAVTEERIHEIREVYAKAEAFDQLAHTYEQYKEGHTHDLKSTMGTKAIELLESDGGIGI